MNELAAGRRDITLLDLLDRILRKGVIIHGEITICLCDIELVYVGLKALVCSIEKARELRQMAADKQGRVWKELEEGRLLKEDAGVLRESSQ